MFVVRHPLFRRRARRLVIDEADTMFDQGFGEEVTGLLNMLRKKQLPVQVITVQRTGLLTSTRVVCSCHDRRFQPGKQVSQENDHHHN